MIFRVTFGFEGSGVGWSETHAAQGSSDNPIDLAGPMRNVAAKRVQMLGRDFRINAIRISRYSDDGGTTRTRGVYLIKQNFANSNTGVRFSSEPAQVALLVRGSADQAAAPAQFRANQNQTFLGGPVDVCVDDGGVVYPGEAGLGAAFGAWVSAVKSAKMGWLASQTLVDKPITALAPLPTGQVAITTKPGLIPALTADSVYKARIRRVNGGVSPLNGELIVRCVDNDSLESEQIIGIALAQTGGAIRVYKAIAPFILYGDLGLESTAANHKRGRPFGSKPGRARRRVRG